MNVRLQNEHVLSVSYTIISQRLFSFTYVLFFPRLLHYPLFVVLLLEHISEHLETRNVTEIMYEKLAKDKNNVIPELIVKNYQKFLIKYVFLNSAKFLANRFEHEKFKTDFCEPYQKLYKNMLLLSISRTIN